MTVMKQMFRLNHLSIGLRWLFSFLKTNAVFSIALLAAIITCVFVPPDATYLTYFDVLTLTCQFGVLAVVCALKNVQFFQIVAQRIVLKFCTLRSALIVLIYITFIASMFIANDMSLLTFLPLGFYILDSTNKRQHMAFTFIMQTISANLGGMLSPFGSPQNLYMYSYYNIPIDEFIGILFWPFVYAVALITLCCIFIKPEPITLTQAYTKKLDQKKTKIYLVLFALAIAIVFHVIPYQLGIVIIVLVLFFMDRQALKDVDYPLLLTISAFFIFSGNMARIPMVKTFMGSSIAQNPLFYGVLSCQFISNVPSAILLSQFTTNYHDLLIAVNLGGLGTLVASLASLITFREYVRHNPSKSWQYIGLYSLFNFAMLGVLLVLVTV